MPRSARPSSRRGASATAGSTANVVSRRMTSGAMRPDTETMAERILIIDDDQRLAGMVSDYLGGAGFRVAASFTAREGEERLKREQFAALVLDLMLPDADGLEVCRRIRQSSDVPILMLTARGDAMD